MADMTPKQALKVIQTEVNYHVGSDTHYRAERLCQALATLRAELDGLRAEVERLRRRAERLEEALREMREYVTAALQAQREAFAGYEHCSDIPGIEADLHKIDTLLREQENGDA